MRTRLIIDGNSVYEIDEDCVECRKRRRNGGSARENSAENAEQMDHTTCTEHSENTENRKRGHESNRKVIEK